MKIGVCSWSFWQNYDEQLEFLVENSFTATSLLQHSMEWDDEQKIKAASFIKDHNLTLTWHSNVLACHLIDGKANREYMKKLYDNVVWWHDNTNGVYSAMSDANLHDVCVEHVDYMRERLSSRGIRFGLENTCWDNENKYFCHPEQMKEIYSLSSGSDEYSPLLGVLVDAGHINVCCKKYGYDIEDYIDKIPAPIWEVHICDNHGESDEHLPLGDGTLDLTKLVRALKRKGFDGVFTYESLRKRDRSAFDLKVDEDREKLIEYRKRIEDAWY